METRFEKPPRGAVRLLHTCSETTGHPLFCHMAVARVWRTGRLNMNVA